jgi:poly-beta-1,6-N-acetyl-D-glucosamine synthase
VAHGMATLFRVEALKSVPSYRKKTLNIVSDIYLEDSLVEDYELTLCLKQNWEVSSCMNMLAWTDVPLSVKELWIQRLRWLRGGVDTLRLHSWNKVTFFEILNHWLFILLLILRMVVSIAFIYYLSKFEFKGFNPIILAIVALSYIDSIYRLKYVQDKTIFDYLIKILLIPEIIYGWFQAIVLISSYILSFCNIKQRW